MIELTTSAEIKALEARKYKGFSGIDLGSIKSSVDEITRHIGRDGIFAQYTRHDITHINQLLKSLDKLIPSSTASKMTAGDWLMLVLSIYFHDLGMVVTKDEYDNRAFSSFNTYKEAVLSKAQPDFLEKINKLEDKEKFLYQEFVRAKHAERVKNWIDGNPATHLGAANVVFDEIHRLLINLDADFRTDLGMICESHHLYDLDDFKKYDVRRDYGVDDNEYVNLHYCALMLRTADLLHITSDRTPSIEYRLINPSDPISQDEWAKQGAVKNVAPQQVRNEEGQVVENIQSNIIEITAKFKGPNGAKGFFGLSSYILYASNELKKNYEWNQKAQKFENSKYEFPWNKIDDSKIRTEGFVPKKFEFSLDQSKILQLLVGHTLYNDSTVVIRELIQNSIDAIKLHSFIASQSSQVEPEGEITVHWNSQDRYLSVTDNGTGMTLDIIEEHLLKVGSSRYQSEYFKNKYPDFSSISRFGIGILTCFLIADDIEIITSHQDEPNANKLAIRNLNGKYLLQYLSKNEIDSAIQAHGTIIKLRVRAGVELSDLLDQLNKWIVFPVCPVKLIIDENKPVLVGFSSPKEAVEKYLSNRDYEVDNKLIKVVEESINGVTIAYGLKYDVFYREWTFLTRSPEDSQQYDGSQDEQSLGNCVEGIRINSLSPGFQYNHGLVSIANATGKNAPTTNVARSLIESDKNEKSYLKTIYSIYIAHIENQIENLQNKHSYSISWAAGEVPYLLQPISGILGILTDLDLFVDELRKARLVLVEREGKRFMTSLLSLNNYEDIWIVDSTRFHNTEAVLKESEGSSSLLSLMHTLRNGNEASTAHISTLLCGFKSIDTMQRFALSERSVTNIKLFHTERRVDVCWSKSGNNWLSLKEVRDINSGYRDVTSKNYYLQNEDFEIDNSEGENIIECFDMIFFVKNSPICYYLLEAFANSNLANDSDKENFHFLISFIQSVYSFDKYVTTYSPNRIDEMLDSSMERYEHHYSNLDCLWGKFDRVKFVEAVANTRWKIFSPAAWDRHH